MVLNIFILHNAESRLDICKHETHPKTFFARYFHMILFFYQSYGHKNIPCFFKQEKNYTRMEIRPTAFPAIAVAITALTDKYRTKNSLL